MNLDNLLHLPPASALGYAILYSLGQGALVFAVLQFTLLWLKRPAQKYHLLYMAMVGLTCLFLFAFFRQWYHLQHQQASIGASQSTIHSEDLYRSRLYGMNQLTPFFPYAGIAYALGLILFLLRMALAWQKLAALKKTMIAASGSWSRRFASLKKRMGLGPQAALYFSTSVRIPMMMGWLKPLVILPTALVNHMDVQQVETILVHELTHIKRKDYNWNMVQLLMEILLFFNPITWWLSAAIRREREKACDDQAMAYISEPIKYAEALLALEVQRMNLTGALAAGGNGSKKLLFNRIKRITTMQTTPKSAPQGWFAIITLITIIAATGSFYKAEAQLKKETKTATINADKQYPPAKEDVEESTTTSLPKAQQHAAAATATLDQAKATVDELDLDQIGTIAAESIDREAIEKALKEARAQIRDVDWVEINQAIQQAGEAVKAIDWNEINDQIKEGLKSVEGLESVEMDQVMEEVRQALKEAKASLGHAESEQRQQIREQVLQTRVILEQSRKKARQQSRQQAALLRERMEVVRQDQKAASLARKEAINDHKDAVHKLLEKQRTLTLESRKAGASAGRLLNDLKANKLIIDSDNVNVRLTEEGLYINGKKQPDAAFKRVKKYVDQDSQSRIIIRRNNKKN